MHCGNCGKQLPDSARFCRYCGKTTTVPTATGKPAATPSGLSAGQKTPAYGQQPSFSGQQMGAPGHSSTKPVSPKAINTKLARTLFMVVLAAVVIGAGVLAIRGIASIGTVSGLVENGNDTGQMIRVGKTTYMVLDNNDKKITQILKVNEKTDAKAQEVYRISWPKDGYTYISLICVKGNTLYYMEYNSYGTGSQFRSFREIKSLNIKKEGNKPTAIELKLKGGKQIPEGFIEDYENTNNKKFSLENLFELSSGFDKNYIYSIRANGKNYGKVILFKINCTNGEISFIEGESLGLKESWGIRMIKDGYVYYVRYYNNVSEGLYRARLSDLKEEKLLDAPDKDSYFSDLRVMDNSFFYIMTIYSSKQSDYELHYLDLKTKKDTIVFKTTNYFTYNMSNKTVYYIEQGDLRSCSYDGSNDKLLIRNRDNAGGKNYLHVLGNWIYYKQNGDWYRVKPGDTEFPTRGLN